MPADAWPYPSYKSSQIVNSLNLFAIFQKNQLN